MLDHPIISGSNYAQARKCSGFPWLNRLVPNVENDWTRRGTRIHRHADRLLKGYQIDQEDEETAHARRYVAALGPLAISGETETRVGDDMCGGSIDGWMESGGVLWVEDLKTGKHPVPPSSWQLKFYAAHLILDRPERFMNVHTIKLGIYQETVSDEMQWETFTRKDLQEWIADINETQTSVFERPTLRTGPHCDKCKARSFCREQKPKKQKVEKVDSFVRETSTDW